MYQEKISIVIPVYNVKPYLSKCVLSVLGQTYKNIEIILVDDGSTDGSGELCERLAETDDRIIVVHQVNKGLSVARNRGIDISSGEWIAFLDSDDWVEPDMYDVLLKLANEYEADIASCSTRVCYLNEEPKKCCNENNDISIFNSIEMIEGLRTQEKVRFEVWNKLWKRETIGEVRFEPGQVSEDIHFDRLVFLQANKMVHTSLALHNYLAARPGNTLSSFKRKRMCVFGEFDALIEDLTRMGKLRTVNIVRYIAIEFAINIYENAVMAGEQEDILKELKQEFWKYYRCCKITNVGSCKENGRILLFAFSPKLFMVVRDIKSKR